MHDFTWADQDQWRNNTLATLAMARGSTFQWAAKSSRLL